MFILFGCLKLKALSLNIIVRFCVFLLVWKIRVPVCWELEKVLPCIILAISIHSSVISVLVHLANRMMAS